MSEQSLGEILGSEEPAIEEPTVEAPEAETPQRERDEHGRFVSKQAGDEQQAEPEASVTPTPEPEQERIPIAALKDERNKRQQLEERLRQYDEYFAQLQAQPKQPTEVPDMFADPDGHQAYVIEQAVQRAVEKLQPAMQQQGTLTRAEVSEMLARQKYEDYDATVEVFKEAIAHNPFLVGQLHQSADPATFAYNAGKQYQQAKSYGTEAPLSREQIEAELREKIVAELNLRPQVPTTLADARSVGSRSGPAWTGPTELGDILKR